MTIKPKLLIFKLKNKEKFLLIHLKMTGQLVYKKRNEIVAGGHEESSSNINKLSNQHTRLIFIFSERSELFYNDLRRFGYLKVIVTKELDKIIGEYGPEPLSGEFNFKNLRQVFKNRKATVKAILLNQKLVAGIGNIYADEILFKARIRPDRQAGKITDKEIEEVARAAKLIIKKAIKFRGTTFSDYIDSSGKKGNFSQFLQVYGRTGKKCLRCRGIIKKEKIAGRGTHYCQKCQK